MENKRSFSLGKLLGVILSLGIVAATFYAVTHKYQILDYISLRNYEPTARIEALASETTMQDGMKRVFFANRPQLNNKAEFRNNCPATEESIVLGCYVAGKGIYLHDVTDERLSGVVQVTAAHEALHAAYDRLSSKERKKIDQQTQSFFGSISDERIKKTVEQYRARDASIVPNELHSILATEIKQLSPELETYYSKYFKNRQQIVAYSEKYEQTFISLSTQVEQYDAQLAQLKTEINENETTIKSLSSDIESRKGQLDQLIRAGRTEQYNAAVPGFNAQVNQYNNLIKQTRQLINEHNQIVEKRNAIATAEQQLIEAINSNITPKETQ